MTEGNQALTVEELQAQLIALQEKQTQQEAQITALSDENKKLNEDLGRAREINTKLFLRIPGAGTNPEEEKPQEEDSFDKLVDETIEKYVLKKQEKN